MEAANNKTKSPVNAKMLRMAAALVTATQMIMLSGCSLTEFASTWGRTSTTEQTASATTETSQKENINNQVTTAKNAEPVKDTATLLVKSGEIVKNNETIQGKSTNESGATVTGQGSLTLQNCTVETTGETTSEVESRHFGKNSGVLAKGAGTLNVNGGKISTSGTGATGAFANGNATSATLMKTEVRTLGDSSAGIRSGIGGSITANNCNVLTGGADSPALAVGRGGGMLTAIGGEYAATGLDSPGIFAGGNVQVLNATVKSAHEAARAEGGSLLMLTGASLESEGDYCILVKNPTKPDEVTQGIPRVEINGGSYSGGKSALIGVLGTKAEVAAQNGRFAEDVITLLKVGSDTLSKTPAQLDFTANGQKLYGDIVCESDSTANIALTNASELNGAINKDNQGGKVDVTIDALSKWNMSADSYISGLTAAIPILKNIKDDGHTLYYDPSNPLNDWINAQTLDLPDGGKLTPSATPEPQESSVSSELETSLSDSSGSTSSQSSSSDDSDNSSSSGDSDNAKDESSSDKTASDGYLDPDLGQKILP